LSGDTGAITQAVLTTVGIYRQEVRGVFLLVVTALFILAVHIVGIWIWAGLFLGMGILETLEAALYFSTVTSTTVGYGDVVLHHDWRLLGSFQGMGGIILFGISTAFIVAVSRSSLKQYFDES
jgi:hypothetical protein